MIACGNKCIHNMKIKQINLYCAFSLTNKNNLQYLRIFKQSEI